MSAQKSVSKCNPSTKSEPQDHSLLQNILQRKRAQIGIIRHLLHDRNETSKLIAATVSEQGRHARRLHFGVLVVQAHEANGVVFLRQSAHAVFDHLGDV